MQKLDAPSLDGTLEPLALGDGGDIDNAAVLHEVVDGDLLAQQGLGVLEPLLDGAAADPGLHEVRDLLGDAGDHLGLRVGKDAHILDVALGQIVPGLLRIIVLGNGQSPRQFVVERAGPDLSDGAQAVAGTLVHPDGRHLHGRYLQHSDGDLYLLAGREALWPEIDYEGVGHADLVPGEPLKLRAFADLGPRV